MPGCTSTTLLERLATASLRRADVERRALWMELSEEAEAHLLARPSVADNRVVALAAAYAELLAERQRCSPPTWVHDVSAVSEGVYLVERSSEAGLARMRAQSPEPLRRRNLFAPASYVQLV